jgi:phage baseplate assembly protein W
MMAGYRQQDVVTPHFSLPFRFGGIRGGAFLNEQDTGDDIVDCVRAIVAFPIGTRADMPEFGVREVVFMEYNEAVVQQVRRAIEEWEDRAVFDVDSELSLDDDFVWDLIVQTGVASDVGV